MLVHLDNEAVLLAEARAGRADAFIKLLNQYSSRVYRLALQITGNREDAEDVLQEVSLKAYANLREFRGDSRFYTWVVRITVNEALTKLRGRRIERQISLDEPIETGENDFMPREIESWGDNPEDRYATSELQKLLAEALEKLEPPYRLVFALRDIEQISTEETAQMLGLSVPTVKSRLMRARLKMRERLTRHFKKGWNVAL